MAERRYKDRGRYYYKYGIYERLNEAMKIARRHRRRNGSRYKIMEDYYGGKKVYCLYLTNVVRY